MSQAPGRTIGMVVMTGMIVFVAWFMSSEGGRMNNDRQENIVAENLDGFSEQMWQLPDDPMLGFVEIPAGEFTMGSNPALDRMAYENERWSRNQRQGKIQLPDYYISRFEITVAQYNHFLSDSGSAAKFKTGASSHPVTSVTWPEALAYSRWLDQRLRQSPNTPPALAEFLELGAQVILPNEAEWEKAARGSDGQIFPWGSQPRSDRAHFGASTLARVGSIPCEECSFGLSDMSGNVWELTRSPFLDYPFNGTYSAVNLSDDALWVMRGGSYNDPINNVRAAVRGGVDPGVRSETIGFRVVISSQ